MYPIQFRFRCLPLLSLMLLALLWFPSGVRAEFAGLAATQEAAERGDIDAQVSLGYMYDHGDGVPQDSQQALAWYVKAAVQGDPEAQANLGLMFEQGRGVPQDYLQATAWYTLAAEQGHLKAQVNLGMMYFQGQGALQNYSLAYAWFSLAAAAGDKKALVNRDLAAAKLDRKGLAEAQALAARLLEMITSPDLQADVAALTPSEQPPSAVPTSTVSGTGFIITPDGHILTCAHVVAKARAIKVVLGERILDATIFRLDFESDLALLKVTVDEPLPTLAFARDRTATLGQDVFTMGFPNPELQGEGAKLTKGSVSSLGGTQDDPRFYQISVPIQPGNSGGPLLDNNGDVVGVVVSRMRDNLVLKLSGSLPQNVNYAIKSAYVLSLIDSLPTVSTRLPAPKIAHRPFADAAAEAERGVVLVRVYE
ncbi:MAG: trypsin-like serine protease [Desulfobulbaceae bacterium]|nr:trypsin-like serine protease [Desulfobulbaceae bacterium]